MEVTEFTVLHVQGPNNGEIFGRWFESFGQILQIKDGNGNSIDSWKEGSSYFILPHMASEKDILKEFVDAAIDGTIAEIFDERESFKIERLFVPYVSFGKEITSINNEMLSCPNKEISGFITLPHRPLINLTCPQDYKGRFFSTNMSYHDMQIIANHNNYDLADHPVVIFMPFWRISLTSKGSKLNCLIMEKGVERILYVNQLPIDNRMEKPEKIRQKIVSNFLGVVLLSLWLLITVTIPFSNKMDESIFIVPIMFALSFVLYYAGLWTGWVIDQICNLIINRNRRLSWEEYCKTNMSHKQATLRKQYGITI